MRHTLIYYLCVVFLSGLLCPAVAYGYDTHRITVTASGCETSHADDYPEGATITITPTALDGYYFSQWADGNADNPRVVTVSADATYTAVFAKIPVYYTLTVLSQTGGTATGGGKYLEGTEATLTAKANEGYEFVRWSDGDKQSTRTVIVNADETYFPVFRVKEYTLTLRLAECGEVHSEKYQHGATVILNATPNEKQQFQRWSDGNTDNPRTITITSDHYLAAYFITEGETPVNHTISISDAVGGSGTGGGEFPHNTLITLSADALSGYRFAGWSDGNTDNPRYVDVVADATYTPLFARTGDEDNTVTLSVNADGCSESIGYYPVGTAVILTATPQETYEFKQWSDGSKENPRMVVLNEDATFVATFKLIDEPEPEEPEKPYEYIIPMGTVSITTTYCGDMLAGEFPIGASLTINVEPKDGSHFLRWSDDNTDNPRTIIVTENVELEAFFADIPTSIEETETKQQTSDAARKLLIDGQMYILRGEKVWTVTGQEVK